LLCLSACPNGTTLLQLDGFLKRNMTLEDFY